MPTCGFIKVQPDGLKEKAAKSTQKWDPVSKRFVVCGPDPERPWFIDTVIRTIVTDSQHVRYVNNKLYYFSSGTNISIRDVTTGTVTTVTLSDGSRQFYVDINNNLYVRQNESVFMMPAVTGNYFGISSMPANQLTKIVGTGSYGVPVSGAVASSSSIMPVSDMTVDYQGNLFMSMFEGVNSNVLTCVVMMPSVNGTFFGQVMEIGRIYIIAGNTNSANNGYNQLATAANLNAPDAVITDRFGNLIVSDSFNGRIGMVPRVAGAYFNVFMPNIGHIYLIAGNGLNNNNTGDGGYAITATLRVPSSMVLDGLGNLYFSDKYNNRIRRITSAGIISNIAGSSPSGIDEGSFGGDGGFASNSQLKLPTGLAISGNNTIYVVDTDNNRIRILTNPYIR